MIGTDVKIWKFPFLDLAEIAFLALHVISAVFFVMKLVVFVLVYIMSNIALILKGQEILFRNFPVGLENLFRRLFWIEIDTFEPYWYMGLGSCFMVFHAISVFSLAIIYDSKVNISDA